MKIRIEVDEKTLKDLVRGYIKQTLGDWPFDEGSLIIETKSKQNYKSEWEHAAFRAVYENHDA